MTTQQTSPALHVLVVEDNELNRRFIRQTLLDAGHQVTEARDGYEALDLIHRQPFDALLTDWMMPQLDGTELIRQMRQLPNAIPITMVVTVLDSVHARQHMISVVGADEFVSKPFEPDYLIERLHSCYFRLHQALPQLPPTRSKATPVLSFPPPFVGIGIAASTGGVMAIEEMMPAFDRLENDAAILITQHGAAWMLETFADMLQAKTHFKVHLAQSGLPVEKGHVYVANGMGHLQINPQRLTLQISEMPPENYVRPSADPMFRSLAKTFGEFAIGVVLTGLGRDGSLGAAEIIKANGLVYVQDPETCVAPYMPRSVVQLGLTQRIYPLETLGQHVATAVHKRSLQLI